MAVRQRVVKIGSCFVDGVLATLSEIEISLSPGIPTFDIIGLCDSSIRESRGRIVSAVRSCGYLMPKGHITVNITPAYMHKSGSGFDLPIALGILFLGQHLPYSDDIRIYAQGELALGGEVKGTPGAIMRLIEAAKSKPDIMLIPEQEINAAACAGVSCMPVKTLMDVCRIFSEDRYLPEEFPFDISLHSQIVNGVNFVTVDDVFGTVTPGQVERFRAEVKKGLPIVLCMHVPIYTDDIWRALVKFWKCAGRKFEDAALPPPEGDYLRQKEDKVTSDFLAYLKKEPLLKAILAGHLHLTAEDRFSPTAVEYVIGGNFMFCGREVLFV